jgi:hypothetical protein
MFLSLETFSEIIFPHFYHKYPKCFISLIFRQKSLSLLLRPQDGIKNNTSSVPRIGNKFFSDLKTDNGDRRDPQSEFYAFLSKG